MDKNISFTLKVWRQRGPNTDGIPDAMKSRLFMDGHFLMIQYQTYKDFNNCYSPTLPGWATSKRYVVVNLETGVAYELGVDLSTQSVHKQ